MTGADADRNGAPRGVIAVGASAGGVEALIQLAAGLSRDLPYAVLVVLHVPSSAPSVLAQIMDRAGPISAVTAADGTTLEAGRIYAAVPDRHLLVDGRTVVLSEGPTENGHRPAINALFRSVALSFGPQAIGVLLSGMLDDGVLGAAAIKSRGGTTVVQHPDDAAFSAMPANAVHAGVVDHQIAAARMGALLARLAEQETEERVMVPDARMELENRIATGRRFSATFDSEVLGPHSGYTCPDCNGALVTVGESNYRCRFGHAWTADALSDARGDEVETALWIALRSLQEKARWSRRMSESFGPGVISKRYVELAEEAELAMTVLRRRLADSGHGRQERDVV